MPSKMAQNTNAKQELERKIRFPVYFANNFI